ncbi:MAG: hypothetical protein AB7E49_00395 [Campylobacterales bacterium]
MTWLAHLGRFFPVRPGEGRLFGLLFAHLFTNALALLFIDTAANALFFERFAPTQMAWTYLMLGGIFVGVGLLYAHAERRLEAVRFLGGMLALSVIVTTAVYAFYLLTHSGAALGLLLMWKEVMRTLFALEFGLAASFLLNIRQSKRLLPMIMGGSFLAATLGGAAVPSLLTWMPVERLILLGLLFSGLTYGTFRLLFSGRALPAKPAGARGNIFSLVWNNPFTRISTLMGSVLSGGALFFLTHYLFFGQLREAYPDQLQMAAFLGLLYSWANLVNLVMAFAGARLLSRFGMMFGVAALPLTLFAVASAGGVLGLLGFASALFHGAVLMMFADRTVRLSIENAAYRTLYQITRADLRLRSIGFRENIVKPLSLAFSAAVTLLLTEALGLGPEVLSLGLALCAAFSLWLIATRFKTRYREALFNHIDRRTDEAIVYDEAALSLLRQRLESPDPVEAAYALEILSKNNDGELSGELKKALASPHPLLRAKAAGLIARGKRLELAEEIRARLAAEGDTSVLPKLIAAFGALESEPQPALEKWLTHPDNAVQAAAFGALARQKTGHGFATALVFLADRLEVEDGRVYPLIAQNPAVHHETLLAVLLDKLDDPRHRFGVSHAIAAFGDKALEPLIKRFERARSFEERLQNLKLIARLGTAASRGFLQKQLFVREPELKNVVYETLAKSGYRHPRRAEVRDLIAQEMDRTARLAAIALRLGEEHFAHLRSQIPGAMEASIGRIFHLLALAYPADRIERVRQTLRKGTPQEKSYALELVDSMIGLSERKRFLDLIETENFEEKIRLIAAAGIKNRRDALGELLSDSTLTYVRWLTASAVYALERLPDIGRYTAVLAAQARNPSAWVREAVARVAGARGVGALLPHIADMRSDEDAVVAAMAAWAYEQLITGAIDENHP